MYVYQKEEVNLTICDNKLCINDILQKNLYKYM